MKSTTLVCAIAAACLGFTSASFAQQGHEPRGANGEAVRIDPRSPVEKDGRDNRNGASSQRDERHQQRGPRERDGHDSGARGADQRQMRDEHRSASYRDAGKDHRDFDHRDAGNERHDRQFGARGPQFYRGGPIPMEYRHRQYVVNDWRPHHLSAPPRGQQWVQVGPDYALIVITSGVIVQLVLTR